MFIYAVVICLFLLFDSYLYGKILNKYVKSLSNINTTLLGLFILLALFQLSVYIGLPIKININFYLIFLSISFILPMIISIICKVNCIPKKYDFLALTIGIAFCCLLGISSSMQTNNSLFFDSNYYLSEVIETSSSSILGHINYYDGSFLYGIDVFHNYQGYYYFWGLIIKLVRNIFELSGSLTPIFIWGASMIYYFSIGLLSAMSLSLLKNKNIIIRIILIFLILPYFTNYFNTTLGFFGNSLRTINIGIVILLCYLFINENDNNVFLPLFFMFLGGLSVSSSTMFINVFIMSGLLLYMLISKNYKYKDYYKLCIACMPLIHYIFILLLPWYIDHKITLVVMFLIFGIFSLVYFLFNKIDKKYFIKFTKLVCIIYFLVFILLILVSFILKDSKYGYSYFFEIRSLDDMCVNYTNFNNIYELIRNLILYICIGLNVLSYHINKKFKCFLLILILLFINPLVQPALSTFATQDVYSRVFDIICNPFTLIFIFSESILFVNNLIIRYGASLFIGSFSLYFGILNCFSYPSRVIAPSIGFNWQYKVSDSQFDMYNYLNTSFLNEKNRERPIIASQDIDLKGYVSNIEVLYGSSDYREAISSLENFTGEYYDIMNLLYPYRVFYTDLVLDQPIDYKNTCPILLEYPEIDYVLMRSNIGIPNENGDYVFTWWEARACGDVVYENSEWVLLKIRK